MAHTNTESNPWWQLEFEATTSVHSITFHNRGDGCASRMFSGTGCDWEYSGSQFPGDDQGAVFGVSQSSCAVGGQCSGTVCQRVTASNLEGQGHEYTLACDPPIDGRYAYVQLPGSSRLLHFTEFSVNEISGHYHSLVPLTHHPTTTV